MAETGASPNESPNESDDEHKIPELHPEFVLPGNPADNVDWTYSEETSYTSNEVALAALLDWYEHNKGVELSVSDKFRMHDKIIAPFYIPEFAGKYSRILWSTTSFAPDNYQPWSSSKDKGAPRPQYTVYSVDGPDGGYHIRVSRTAHQKNSDFRKEHIRIEGIPELENLLFVSYIYAKTHMVLPTANSRCRIDKRTARILRRAVVAKGLEGALTEHIKGIPEQPTRKMLLNICRSMPGIARKKKGRITGPNFDRLYKLRRDNPDLHIYTVDGGNKKMDIEILYVCRESCTLFLADAPNAKMLQRHHDEIDKLKSLPPNDHAEFIKMKHAGTTASSTIKRLSSFVQADTTFNMTDFYITLIVGVVERFRTKDSKKCRPIVLGFVFHTNREMHHHSRMGDYLATMFESIDSTKRVTATITDGEPALKQLFKGICFSMATPLRCDVHIKRNFSEELKKLISPEEMKSFFIKVFGTTQKKKMLGTCLIGGLLSNVTKQGYQQSIKSIKKHFHDNEHIVDAIDKRAKSLWKHNSMFYKMRAGIVAQFVSTNVIEGQNNRMQAMFKRAEGAHITVERLIDFIKEDLLENFKAVVQDNDSKVCVSFDFKHRTLPLTSWDLMKCHQKQNILTIFALPQRFAEKDSAIPEWLREDHPLLDKFIRSCTVYQVPKTLRFVVHKKQLWAGGMTLEGNDEFFKCCEDSCERRKRVKLEPCPHIAAVLVNMHQNESMDYWNYYEANRETQTATQLFVAERKKKQGQKRDGNKASHHNRKRVIDDMTFNYSNQSNNASGMSEMFREEEEDVAEEDFSSDSDSTDCGKKDELCDLDDDVSDLDDEDDEESDLDDEASETAGQEDVEMQSVDHSEVADSSVMDVEDVEMNNTNNSEAPDSLMEVEVMEDSAHSADSTGILDDMSELHVGSNENIDKSHRVHDGESCILEDTLGKKPRLGSGTVQVKKVVRLTGNKLSRSRDKSMPLKKTVSNVSQSSKSAAKIENKAPQTPKKPLKRRTYRRSQVNVNSERNLRTKGKRQTKSNTPFSPHYDASYY